MSLPEDPFDLVSEFLQPTIPITKQAIAILMLLNFIIHHLKIITHIAML